MELYLSRSDVSICLSLGSDLSLEVVFRFLLSLDTGLNKYIFSSADGVRNTHIHTDRETTPYCLAGASVADPLRETT